MRELEVARRDVEAGSVRPAASGRYEMWSLNRPERRNALDPRLVGQLRDALVRAEASRTRVVVLNGNGPSSCAGADLKHLESYDPSGGLTPRAFLGDIWDLTLAMENSDIVFVAALHGHAIAGGLELALACDVVLAANGTLIGDGHLRNSLLPGGGASARMERSLGRSTATWLGLTGQLLDADDPALATWLRAVVDAEDRDRSCHSIVQNLLAAPAESQRHFKRLLHAQHPPATTDQKQRELDAFERNWIDNNVPAAVRLFLSRKAS